MRIVILDGYTENPGDLSWAGFKALGDTVVYDRSSDADILPRAKGAEIVITNKTPLTREVLTALAPELNYVGVLATGYNVVDVQAARELGIPVTNIPTYGTQAVAQMTIALLLELCHHVGEHAAAVREGAWSRSQDFCFWLHPLTELAGKTMGLIGYGRIGKSVAKLVAAFDMKVLYHDPTAQDDHVAESVPLEELYARSDVISLHCPLTAENTRMINAQSIAVMKRGVWLVNTARGALVDDAALAQALHSGQVGGAVLDVLTQEPPAADQPLLKAPNCLITPHIAWAPRESRQRLMDIAVGNLSAFLDGAPINVVN